MDENDLEKTRALNELNDLIMNQNNNSSDNEMIDIPDDINITSNSENKEELYNDLTTQENNDNSKNKKEKKNIFKKLKEKWSKLSKKKKIIIISITSVILILLIVLIIVLVSNKKEEKPQEVKQDIILAKDNYVYKNGFLNIIDDSDNVLGTYECDNKDENKCYVAYLSNDEDPFEVPVNKYSNDEIIKTRSQIYQDRYVFIFDNDKTDSKKIKLYDMRDNKTLEEYYGIKSYNVENKNAVILIDETNNYGLYEFSSDELKTLIASKYDYLGLIDKENDNLIVAKDSKGYLLIDYNAKAKTKVFNNQIVDYNDEYVLVKTSNNKYSVYNYTGEEFNKDYDYIRLLDTNYIAVVKDKNLFIRGYSDNKFNEEGYELTNTDYAKVNIFDESNKLISTTFSFETELHEKTLTIKIANSDNTTREEQLNLLDGEVSTKYDYYSYLNGKLYFYDNEEKTNLIGTYECKNKNNITGETFNNCYVAKDNAFNDSYINPKKNKDAVIALFNKKYVFIFDAPELQNETNIEIKFYDLKQNKVLGTYTKIDANMADSVPSLTLVDTADTKVIAKLKSGKYGVIKISNNDASVLHKFEYNYIERAGKDFIVQLENNNWQIVYQNNYTSSEFPGKIMNYNNGYVVVRNSGKDYAYKGDGQSVINVGFDYVDISNTKVFGGVSSNKLDIYTYDGDKVNTDILTLSSNTYYNTSTPSFKIAGVGNDITVYVYNTNGTLNYTKTYSIVKKETIPTTDKDDKKSTDNTSNSDNNNSSNSNSGGNDNND